MGKYDDIINLKHPTSKNHKPMSIYDRSAQFAPFAALVGYDESINEASRVIDKKIELSYDKIEEIGQTLSLINQRINEHPTIEINYFKKDNKKEGGKYITIRGQVMKIDIDKKLIILSNKSVISFIDIIDIFII